LRVPPRHDAIKRLWRYDQAYIKLSSSECLWLLKYSGDS
jgi:hypothetical protein